MCQKRSGRPSTRPRRRRCVPAAASSGPPRARTGSARPWPRWTSAPRPPSWTRWPRCRPTRTSATCPRCWPISWPRPARSSCGAGTAGPSTPRDVHHVPDVIKALELAITHYSRPGSPVILPTPAYMPFLSVPGYLGREIIQVRMRDEDGFFTLDLDAIEDAFRAGGHLLIFCNPYNPLGRVFTGAEIAQLTDVVDRHGGRVFADEIHAALVYPGQRHLPYAATSAAAAAHTLTATSASKAWNLPGLKCAQVILSSDPDRQALGGDGLLRLARGQQPRRGGQHRRLPARRGVAGRGPGLPRRQPPAAGRPAAPPPAPGALPSARRHVPGLARLHGHGPARLARRPGHRARPGHGDRRARLRRRRPGRLPAQLRHAPAHPHRDGRAQSPPPWADGR